ncbi:MAG: LicD family protein [Paracoccaceae bacterium]
MSSASQDKLVNASRIRELRAIGYAALSFGPLGLDMKQCFSDLLNLTVAPEMRAEFLEARIALCIAGRMRPAKTVRAIKNLKELRTQAGQLDQFEAFEQLFHLSLGTLTLTNHAYSETTFANLDHGLVWQLVKEHIRSLQDAGYHVFLNSGTLLGVVRDQRLIDHDDDIDLAVVLNATDAESAVQEWLHLTETLRQAGVLDLEKFADPAILKLASPSKLHIDLFPCWFEDDAAFIYPHSFGEVGRHDIFPLQPCAVTGGPIPADPAKVLAQNYGEDWQHPDPYFKFPWNVAYQKFATFLTGVRAA